MTDAQGNVQQPSGQQQQYVNGGFRNSGGFGRGYYDRDSQLVNRIAGLLMFKMEEQKIKDRERLMMSALVILGVAAVTFALTRAWMLQLALR